MRRWLKLRQHKVRKPHLVIKEAKRAGLPLPDALAMLEQETGIPQKNIFGCDQGSILCHEKVTRKSVRRLVHHIRGGGIPNGVGWTQITYQPFVYQAQDLGGAWKPKYQMRVGFKVLADLIRQHGVQQGHAAYNGTGAAAQQYGRVAVELRRKWQRILN